VVQYERRERETFTATGVNCGWDCSLSVHSAGVNQRGHRSRIIVFPTSTSLAVKIGGVQRRGRLSFSPITFGSLFVATALLTTASREYPYLHLHQVKKTVAAFLSHAPQWWTVQKHCRAGKDCWYRDKECQWLYVT
jgi:hypothetical protein